MNGDKVRSMTDWRQKALDNQAAMADLHRRRTATEHRQLMKAYGSPAKPPKSLKRWTKNQQTRYWIRRAKAAESLLRKQGGKPATGNTFYQSREWQVLRYQALKLHGRKCQLCGNTGKLHVDHIKPRSRYPELELRLDNLQVLCADCNMGKGAWDESDWRKGALKNIPRETDRA